MRGQQKQKKIRRSRPGRRSVSHARQGTAWFGSVAVYLRDDLPARCTTQACVPSSTTAVPYHLTMTYWTGEPSWHRCYTHAHNTRTPHVHVLAGAEQSRA